MIAFLQNLALMIIWVALTEDFSPANLLLGFVFGAFLLWFGRGVTGRLHYFQWGEDVPGPFGLAFRFWLLIKFVVIFVWEVILANINIMLTVLKPHLDLQPAIIALPLDIDSDIEITMLANMITLTPGTLSLDVSDDRRTLYVHCVYASNPDETKRELKDGFETLVHEVIG
jgi:multicomponent Na+:H+ antiporter subunit E